MVHTYVHMHVDAVLEFAQIFSLPRPQTRKNNSQEGDCREPAMTQPHNSDMATADTAQPIGTAPEAEGGKAKEERKFLEERYL